MNCAELEILLCDYVDGTLHGEQKSAVEQHLTGCPECAVLARDAAGAVRFFEGVPALEAPPELVTRIQFDLQTGRIPAPAPKSWIRRFLGRWLEPVLQPRFAIGMAMTVLSFAMLGRFSGIQIRQLKPSDLDPVKVWQTVDDKAHRVYDRAVKYYENLRWVYEIQSRLKEWNDQAEAEQQQQPSGAGGSGGGGGPARDAKPGDPR
jgi:anti-sigma factor RsiW